MNIFLMPAKQHPELTVSRVFEKVDESKGIDSNGQFNMATAITDKTFQK